MPEFMDLIETISSEQASIHRLFNRGEDGTGVREASLRRMGNPAYVAALTEAVRFTGEVFQGKRPMAHLREALSTSDFPLLFGDTIDRMMLANFQNYPGAWRQYLKVSRVPDFRDVKRFRLTDGSQRLLAVGQGENYPQGALSEASYSFSVNKYGRRFDMLWEALTNDDLDALANIPDKMAVAARRAEDYFAASLYVGNTTLYATNHSVDGTTYSNKGTAALTLANLEAAWNAMSAYPDDANSDGAREPIFNQPRYLVVPPQLELTAQKTVGQINYISSDETNVLRGRLQITVDPYIPIVDGTNGATSWYLFADPTNGHAAEVGFLAGHDTPQMFMKSPNAVRLGGGTATPVDGDYDTDSIGYKVRHVVGGSHANAVGGWRYTYWSDGSA